MSHENDKPTPIPLHRAAPLPRPARLPGITPRPGTIGAGNPDTITPHHHRTDTVSDPQIICTNCGTEMKLTESLAAPIIAAARKQFDAQLAAKEADFGRREAQLRQTQDDLAKARESLDDQVATKLRAERAAIAEAEAKKARLALADDLGQRDRQLADLQEMLATNNAKLAEAQQAQTDMLRKQRELEDAKREVELTVEKKVQENLGCRPRQGQARGGGCIQVQGHRKGGPARWHAAPDRGTASQGRPRLSTVAGRSARNRT